MYHTLTMTDMTKDEAIKYLQQLYPNGGCSWLDEQRIEAISMAIDALKEKPVSEDLEQAADEYSDRILSENRGKYNPDWDTYADGYEQSICAHVYPAFIDGAKWQKEQMMKDAVERIKKKMITRAIAWVEWNNRNGSCLFDGWKESLMEAMKGE